MEKEPEKPTKYIQFHNSVTRPPEWAAKPVEKPNQQQAEWEREKMLELRKLLEKLHINIYTDGVSIFRFVRQLLQTANEEGYDEGFSNGLEEGSEDPNEVVKRMDVTKLL